MDYDKDSEEELLEENAEDIKSDENSDEEEKQEEEEEEEGKWIVPDGHLSEDEVSEKEVLNNSFIPSSKGRNIHDILEIRKNYPKPIERNLFENLPDYKTKNLIEALKARIFNHQTTADNGDMSQNHNFPIQVGSKKMEEMKNKQGMSSHIKDRLEEVAKEINFSFMTKEYLIKLINEKYPEISKKSLANFFREYCLKSKVNVYISI